MQKLIILSSEWNIYQNEYNISTILILNIFILVTWEAGTFYFSEGQFVYLSGNESRKYLHYKVQRGSKFHQNLNELVQDDLNS